MSNLRKLKRQYHGILQLSFLSPQELTCSPVATIFFVHIFWVSHYFVALPPLRGPRTITLYGNGQFAVGGSARFDPGTSASQSNAPPLRHLSSSLQICFRFCRLIRSIKWFPTERGSAKAGSLLRAVAVVERTVVILFRPLVLWRTLPTLIPGCEPLYCTVRKLVPNHRPRSQFIEHCLEPEKTCWKGCCML
jgi:hypothetical protein